MIYFIVANFQKLVLIITRGLKVYGRENVPEKGAFLFIANHLSNNDPFLIAAGTKRHLAYMAKDKLFENPFLRFWLTRLGVFPINREGDPRQVLNQTVEILKSGKPTTMFPEGTRNKEDETLQEFKKGAALVAIRAGVPVVPAAILGTNRKKGRIAVLFGKPMTPPEYSKENIARFNEEMAARVAELIDELRKKLYEK